MGETWLLATIRSGHGEGRGSGSYLRLFVQMLHLEYHLQDSSSGTSVQKSCEIEIQVLCRRKVQGLLASRRRFLMSGFSMKTVWLSGQRVGLKIQQSQVRVPL